MVFGAIPIIGPILAATVQAWSFVMALIPAIGQPIGDILAFIAA
jgi:hypothetical protein